MLVYRPGLNTSRIVIQDRLSFFLVLNKSELVTPYFRHVEEPCREFFHLLGVQQLLPIVAKKVTAMVQEITAVESHQYGLLAESQVDTLMTPVVLVIELVLDVAMKLNVENDCGSGKSQRAFDQLKEIVSTKFESEANRLQKKKNRSQAGVVSGIVPNGCRQIKIAIELLAQIVAIENFRRPHEQIAVYATFVRPFNNQCLLEPCLYRCEDRGVACSAAGQLYLLVRPAVRKVPLLVHCMVFQRSRVQVKVSNKPLRKHVLARAIDLA